MEDMDLNQPARRKPIEIQSEISLVGELEKERPSIFSLLALEILKRYRNRLNRLNKEKPYYPSYNAVYIGNSTAVALSTEEVIKVARAKLTKIFSQTSDDLPTDFSAEDSKNVKLALFLLASAETVSNQQYDHANALLDKCHSLSSITGNPVERIVYYFVEALRERINRQTGRIASGRLDDEEVDEAMRSPTPTMLACLQEIPFLQPTQFSGVQTVEENVVNAKRVHVIDLEIRTGVQWTMLMQALVVQNKCPLELFKITAVTTTSKRRLQNVGKSLMDFAKTINLPLSFKIVMVSDFKDISKDVFEVETDEVLIVYSQLFFKSLLSEPDCLESVMRLIKNLQPRVMVVTEVEANHNSPAFLERFNEALFFYSAIFDGIESCLDRFNPNRICFEGIYLSHMIRTIVATEGKERTTRHEKMEYWRSFFTRFGMVEMEFSASSLYQANLVVKKFPCGSSCTTTMNGKCLITGWKGIPIFSVSVWKFP